MYARQVGKPWWLGPDTQQIVIVIGEDDPATGTDGAHHVPHDRERIANVFEHEPGMGDVESSPFALRQASLENIGGSKIDEVSLGVRRRQAFRPVEKRKFVPWPPSP